MRLYGDISGNYGNLLTGDCDLVVHVLVYGEDEFVCGSCPKKIRRRLGNRKEVKWRNLEPVERRRMADCFEEKSDQIGFYYAAISREDVNGLYANYLLYDGDGPNAKRLPKIIGIVYAELFNECLLSIDYEPTFPVLEFDSVYHDSNSVTVKETITRHLPGEFGFHRMDWKRSNDVAGIQAADCFAGLIAEHELGRNDWSDSIEVIDPVECSGTALARLENYLEETSRQ